MATLSQKLQLKPGARVRVVGAPADLAKELGPAVKDGEAFNTAIVFVDSIAGIEDAAANIVPRLGRDDLLWFAYRKGAAAKQTGLNRDVGWDAMKAIGWRPVRAISFNDVWSGIRYRPVDLVKTGR